MSRARLCASAFRGCHCFGRLPPALRVATRWLAERCAAVASAVQCSVWLVCVMIVLVMLVVMNVCVLECALRRFRVHCLYEVTQGYCIWTV